MVLWLCNGPTMTTRHASTSGDADWNTSASPSSFTRISLEMSARPNSEVSSGTTKLSRMRSLSPSVSRATSTSPRATSNAAPPAPVRRTASPRMVASSAGESRLELMVSAA